MCAQLGVLEVGLGGTILDPAQLSPNSAHCPTSGRLRGDVVALRLGGEEPEPHKFFLVLAEGLFWRAGVTASRALRRLWAAAAGPTTACAELASAEHKGRPDLRWCNH